jgi:hypothetical protein
MARLVLDNLTKKQAEAFASYFEGQGEQDCEMWMEERGCKAPLTDIDSSKGPWHYWHGDDLIIRTR